MPYARWWAPIYDNLFVGLDRDSHLYVFHFYKANISGQSTYLSYLDEAIQNTRQLWKTTSDEGCVSER